MRLCRAWLERTISATQMAKRHVFGDAPAPRSCELAKFCAEIVLLVQGPVPTVPTAAKKGAWGGFDGKGPEG